jgi:hypothetical protein
MSTRIAQACLSFAVGTLATLAMCPMAAADRVNVQCYGTVLGTVCLDLTSFPWVGRSSDYDCIVPPYDHCVDASIPADALVPVRFPNGEWSAPVPVGKLPAPLSGGTWPAPLPRNTWPDWDAIYGGASPPGGGGLPSVPGGVQLPSIPGLPKLPFIGGQ